MISKTKTGPLSYTPLSEQPFGTTFSPVVMIMDTESHSVVSTIV